MLYDGKSGIELFLQQDTGRTKRNIKRLPVTPTSVRILIYEHLGEYAFSEIVLFYDLDGLRELYEWIRRALYLGTEWQVRVRDLEYTVRQQDYFNPVTSIPDSRNYLKFVQEYMRLNQQATKKE